MKERSCRDETFQVTGRDLLLYRSYILISFFGGVAVLIIISMTLQALLGLFEAWVEMVLLIAYIGSMLLVTLPTPWGVFFFWKPRLGRWLEERRVPPEGGADEAAEAA